ncbi:Gfo/Idh/MocA family oxidoreductase, partial [Akkermansiaceae bacterium]|nr:Gfo/Idh/MocA family oxidoreductase [Akkermansiaceae bacterium]
MTPKQKIGIIGSGFIVNDCHLPAYRKIGLNITAIASRTNANACKTAKLHNIPKVHENIESLLDDSSIEILDIA